MASLAMLTTQLPQSPLSTPSLQCLLSTLSPLSLQWLTMVSTLPWATMVLLPPLFMVFTVSTPPMATLAATTSASVRPRLSPTPSDRSHMASLTGVSSPGLATVMGMVMDTVMAMASLATVDSMAESPTSAMLLTVASLVMDTLVWVFFTANQLLFQITQ